MKLAAFIALLCLPTLANAQAPSPAYTDVGVIANNTYTNQCVGVRYQPPSGWAFQTSSRLPGVALRPGDGSLGLLSVHRDPPAFYESLHVVAIDAPTSTVGAERYIQRAARGYVDGDPARREILRDVYPVDLAERTFYRADLHSPFYHSVLATYFRQYFIVLWLGGDSPEHLKEAAAALAGLSFEKDDHNSNCTLSPNPPDVISGVISSKPLAVTPGSLVRVSEGVSHAMLLENPEPLYPSDASAMHIEGNVVLKAHIAADGSVEDLQVLSGDPTLAPAALEAAHKWKYKPYLLNGVPVRVETTVTVKFVLHPAAPDK